MINFAPSTLAPLFRYTYNRFATNPGSTVPILAENPNRVAIIFQAVIANVWVQPGVGGGVNNSIQVLSGGAPLIFKFADVGGLVGLAWTAFGTGGGSFINVYDVTFNPSPGDGFGGA